MFGLSRLALWCAALVPTWASFSQFDIELRTDPKQAPKAGNVCGSEILHRITDSRGLTYRCCKRRDADVVGHTAGAATLFPRGEERHTRLSRAASRVQALLHQAEGSACLRSQLGPSSFWTYEVCGDKVTQFRPAPPAGDSAGPVFALGYSIASLRGKALAAAQRASEIASESETHDIAPPPKGKVNEDADLNSLAVADEAGLVADARGSILLRTHYIKGSDGRSASVDYRCGTSALGSGVGPFSIASINEDPASLEYVITVDTNDAVLCDLLPDVGRLIAAVNGTAPSAGPEGSATGAGSGGSVGAHCLHHSSGWWTYEVCLGRHVRQYHAKAMPANPSAAPATANGDGSQANKPAGAAVGAAIIEQESSLGAYDWRHGEVLERAGDTVGEPPAIVQRYVDGTPCDLLGGRPRTTEVRIECLPKFWAKGHGNGGAGEEAGDATGSSGSGAVEVAWGLKSITEPSTCSYRLVIALTSACAHPELAPAGLGSHASSAGGLGHNLSPMLGGLNRPKHVSTTGDLSSMASAGGADSEEPSSGTPIAIVCEQEREEDINNGGGGPSGPVSAAPAAAASEGNTQAASSLP